MVTIVEPGRKQQEIIMKGTALITGGAKRIGRAITQSLAEAGYSIALHYNSSEEAARETQSLIENLNVKCTLFQANFADRSDVRNLISNVFDEFPDCNLLVNNASIFERGSLVETEEEQFDRHFDVNLRTPFFLSRDFARHCKQGHIVNIIDTKAARNVIQYFVYTLTKKALLEFTRMAAKELAPAIRVNGIAPGLILPPRGKGEDYLKELSSGVPLKRTGNPDFVVHALRFLLENEYVTGQCLFVDGGEHLK